MKYDLKVLIVFLWIAAGNLSCNDSSATRDAGIAGNSSTSETSMPGLQVKFESLSTTTLYTSDTPEESCLDFQVKLTDANNLAIAGLSVSFSIVSASAVADKGLLLPTQTESDENGYAPGKYCAGKNELVGSLIALAQGVSATSSEITVYQRGNLRLSFIESSVPAEPESENSEDIIVLNIFESGPNDCTTLYFKLEINETALAGQEIEFLTQPNFPKGAKLAKKNTAGEVVTDSVNGRKSGYYKATSSSDGILAVPVCAGTALGTLLVTGSILDNEGKNIRAHSPVISIKGGMPNYLNFSLTFDWENARTLKGYFNNNSPFSIPTEVKVGTRYDGDPILDYQVAVAAETGKIVMQNGGLINPETGTAKFEMSALHMLNQYAYPVHMFSGFPEARARCQPQSIAASLAPSANFTYVNLAKNWRSTVVYMIRGQEFYYDRNGNGVWDGGDGFWDKNQNGIFDDGDVHTYDYNNTGSFDFTSEWFIDLPSPYIDVNENNVYNSGIDIALSDDGFIPPNGVWDKDTIVWKYEYFPIYMGTSPYAMKRYRIHEDFDADYAALTDVLMNDLWTSGVPALSRAFGHETINSDRLWIGVASDALFAGEGSYSGHVFAHGICGNPIPGGTEIKITPELVKDASYGDRQITNHIYIQPGDDLLEPARRILKNSSGSDTAQFNFNAVEHPYKAYSYPINFRTRISICDNACTGDVTAAGGVACDSKTWDLFVSFSEPESTGGGSNNVNSRVVIPNVKTCICVTGASFFQGNCQCPDGTSSNGTNCVADAP